MRHESDKPRELKARLVEYALQVIRLYCDLPKTDVARVLGRQLLRSGTSVGAHHREASRARSRAEFVSKMETGLQEIEENEYWLELLAGSGTVSETELRPLVCETQELNAIFTASVKTAKGQSEDHS
jgi:four helix bundle protein